MEGCKAYEKVYQMISQISVQTFTESLDVKFNHAVNMAKSSKLPVKVYLVDGLRERIEEVDADIDKIKARIIEITTGIFFDHTETCVRGGNIPHVMDDRYVCLDIIL
jgi:hypothetical protein